MDHYSLSSNQKRTKKGLLYSSYWDGSNGSKVAFLSSIDVELTTLLKMQICKDIISQCLLMIGMRFYYHSNYLNKMNTMSLFLFFFDH